MASDKIRIFRNPLHFGEYRNKKCVCGSGVKIKNCHGVDRGLTEDELKNINDMTLKHNAKMIEELKQKDN